MKQINVYFEDQEMIKLLKLKGKSSWHDFIMSKTKGELPNAND